MTAFAGQRETTFQEEKERADTHLEFFSTFHLLVLACASSQGLSLSLCIKAPVFYYLHIVLASFHACLYFVASPSQVTFKPELSPYFGGRTYLFQVVPHLCRKFGTSGFFLSFLNTVVIHLWLADIEMSALARVTLRSVGCSHWHCVLFLFFSSLSLSPEILFITWTSHIILLSYTCWFLYLHHPFKLLYFYSLWLLVFLKMFLSLLVEPRFLICYVGRLL